MAKSTVRFGRVGSHALVALSFVASAAAGQARTSAIFNDGLRLDLGLSYGRPYLDEPGKALWNDVGAFRAGLGVGLGLGYDWRHFGATIRLDQLNAPIGERDGSIGTVALLVHWMPGLSLPAPFRAWRPVATIGYAGIGIDTQTEPELGHVDDSRGLLGSEFQFGVALERRLSRRFSTQIGVDVDAARFGRVKFSGLEGPLGMTVHGLIPRGVVRIAFQPF